MIIECINCYKKFDINPDLIPTNGRKIQCGSCNHVWFFKKSHINITKSSKKSFQKNNDIELTDENFKINQDKLIKNTTNFVNKTVSTNSKNKQKSNFTFFSLLSYILVLIITFVALIIILDTFKSPLYKLFPNLEFLLFSLFETLKDIVLFAKDLL